jgi:hypothetical protein
MLLILSFSWNCFSCTASQAGNPFISWPHRDKGLSCEETKIRYDDLMLIFRFDNQSEDCIQNQGHRQRADVWIYVISYFRSYLFPTTFVAGKWIQQLELSFPYKLHITENYSFHLCMCVCVCARWTASFSHFVVLSRAALRRLELLYWKRSTLVLACNQKQVMMWTLRSSYRRLCSGWRSLCLTGIYASISALQLYEYQLKRISIQLQLRLLVILDVWFTWFYIMILKR